MRPMAKASRCYTGKRASVGTPTLRRNDTMQLIRMIRNAREEKKEKRYATKDEKRADVSGD